MAKLSEDFRSHLREFAWSLSNGSLSACGDYRKLLRDEPAFIENIFALWSNILELDEKGNVLNGEQARVRVEQYIRTWLEKDFQVEPAFEDWEFELY